MRAKLAAVSWPPQGGFPSGVAGEALLGDTYRPSLSSLAGSSGAGANPAV